MPYRDALYPSGRGYTGGIAVGGEMKDRQKLAENDSLCAARVAELEAAVRAMAEQNATLSVCDGNVTVTMDATLTDAEREAIRVAKDAYAENDGNPECESIAAVLSGLLERTRNAR